MYFQPENEFSAHRLLVGINFFGAFATFLSKEEKFTTNVREHKFLGCLPTFSTSTQKLSYFLDGESSRGRGSDDQEEALIHPIAICY